MNLYSWSGTLLFWSAGFRISIKGQQASRAEAPILVGAPHSSFLEALIIYMCGSSPVSRHENKTAFLISACQIFYQAIFVDRYFFLSKYFMAARTTYLKEYFPTKAVLSRIIKVLFPLNS